MASKLSRIVGESRAPTAFSVKVTYWISVSMLDMCQLYTVPTDEVI